MSLFNNTITARRYTFGVVNGIVVEDQPVEFTFLGTVQPVSGKDIMYLPAGRRDTGVVKIYTADELQISSEAQNLAGDRILFANREYEVFQILPNQNGLLSHNKYFASLVPGGANG
jgi:hypothetical protein